MEAYTNTLKNSLAIKIDFQRSLKLFILFIIYCSHGEKYKEIIQAIRNSHIIQFILYIIIDKF